MRAESNLCAERKEQLERMREIDDLRADGPGGLAAGDALFSHEKQKQLDFLEGELDGSTELPWGIGPTASTSTDIIDTVL